MATQNKPVANVCHASVMATLTAWTQGHVTPQLASVSSACTTLKALPVLTVNLDTMVTLWPMTADVSDNSRYASDSKAGLKLLCYHIMCLGCVCVISGTKETECGDGHCHCDRQTGACRCRENVEGHNCDQCAPNHWNYGQDRGCEPCNCNPDHSMGTYCNMVMVPSR